MTSNIDPTKPTYGKAYTSDVRANFSAAKTEIEALQNDVAGIGNGVVSSFNTRKGDVTLLPADVNTALGYTPYDVLNPQNYQTLGQVSALLVSYVPIAQKGAVNGVASLDASGVVPMAQLPATITGQPSYQGNWNPATNTNPTLATGGLVNGSLAVKGTYWIVSQDATTAAIDGITTWKAKDWAISNGSIWQRVDNSTSGSFLPIAGGTLTGPVTGPQFTTPHISVYTTDVTKSLEITSNDAGLADIEIVDEYGFVGVIIDATGRIQASGFDGYSGTFTSLTLSSITGLQTLDVTGAVSTGPITANGFVNAAGPITAQGTVTGTALSSTGSTTTTAVYLNNTSLFENGDGIGQICITDEFGNVAITINVDGSMDLDTITLDELHANKVILPPGNLNLVGDSLQLPNFTVYDLNDGLNDVYFVDEFGNVAFGIIGIDGSLLGGGGGGGGSGSDPNSYSPEMITARDALAVANSMAVRDQTNSQIQMPVFTHNMIIIYGQSLSIGNQGLPRIAADTPLDTLCLGLSPGGSQTDTDFVFIPDTNNNLNLMDSSTRNYETPGIGAVNQWRWLQLRWRGLASDPNRRFVINGCGSGGKAIEQLSKGFAVPCFYDRIPNMVNQVKAAVMAANASNTFGVVAVYYLQGEANYGINTGYDNTRAGYKAKWEQLRSDITTDVMAITGQKLPPAYFASQPSSEWDYVGINKSEIGMAYIDACTTPPLGDYLCMPNYQIPNSNPNGPHMSPDGYRMMGNCVGKIMHKIFERGEGWLPLYPVKATFRGTQILLECHTPEPPLQIQQFYSGDDGSTIQPVLADLGFTAGDDNGTLVVMSVNLYNSIIIVNVSRTPTTNCWINYADRQHLGCGNVCDSDPFISFNTFKTLPVANIGKPYPNFNWMVACRIPVTADV